MRELDTLTFHPTAEKIVKILCQKTQIKNPVFFRILVTYYIARAAAMMRVKIATKFAGTLPVNVFALNLAPSGHAKGHSTSIIEEQIIRQFMDVFEDQTLPVVADENLAKIALKRATAANEDPDVMMASVEKEYKELGPFAPSFNTGTTAAVRQMRHKLLMANIGSVNLEIDEIGRNLLGNADVLDTFLELYDLGKLKPKLIKNTRENSRNQDVKGATPTNLMLFGEPHALLNGDKTEELFKAFLKTGYARRCIFGLAMESEKDLTMTAAEMYDALTDPDSEQDLKDISANFAKLANITNYNKKITMSKDVSIELLEYRLHCEKKAHKLSEFQDIAKMELSHRHSRALKISGAYAFLDGHAEVTADNLYHAIAVVEESGKAFKKIDQKEPNYIKLARFITGVGHDVTQVDLMDNLAFFKGTAAAKNEMIQQAVTWGYKNHMIIKKSMIDGIEFLKGETLKKTNLDKMIISYSTDISDGYQNKLTPFNKLYSLSKKSLIHWINHHTSTGHRDEDCMVPGFNMIVLDIDNGTSIGLFNKLMGEYQYLAYTTKRHTKTHHRFRVIMPLNYQLALSREDFKEFMANIYEWLPVQITPDTQTGQRSRKWLTHTGQYVYSKGDKLLDALLFIPKTSKNDKRKQTITDLASLSRLERWFIQNSSSGNRNNQLVKYALILVDAGYDVDAVRTSVLTLNDKLPDSLKESEIDSTIMKTVGNKALNKQVA